MIIFHYMRRSLVTFCICLIATGVFAQAQPGNSTYEPQVGQEGKDVIWVPTVLALVNKMLDMAKVTPTDYLIDLGSGDGRTVITAAKRGTRALGIEYNPDMVALSKQNAAKEGVSGKAQFVQADLFESDFTQATVLTMFLLPEINLKLRPQILDLNPGTRVVSNSFTMGEWTPDQTASVNEGATCDTYCTAYLWVVPAKVEGTWKLPQGELAIRQSFQKISGTLKSGANATPIRNGMMQGEQITFKAGNAQYTGSVSGNAMKGTCKSGGNTTAWNATRVRTTVQTPSGKS